MPSRKQTYVKQIHTDTDSGLFLADYAAISMSASIFSLKGLLENKKKSKLNTSLQSKFAINKRQANSIIAFIDGEIKSASESHSRHIKTLSNKIKSLKASVDSLEKKIREHIEYLQAVVKYNQTTNKSKKAKIPQKYKPQFDEACSRAFGRQTGTYYQSAKNKLHHQKRKLHLMISQLKYLQSKQLHVNLGNKETIYFVGSKDESKGNQVCQLILGLEKDSLDVLKIRVPNALESRYGEYVEIPINLNGYGDKEIRQAWASGQSITYRIVQHKYGVWFAHITVDVHRPITSDSVMLGCIGVDLNINSVAWCKVNADGNPKRFGEIKFNLHSLSHNQTEATLADVITELTTLALAYKCPIVIEELDFDAKKSQLNSGIKHKPYNRMISGFAYRRFYELLDSRCFKLGIKLITVNPAYSTVIGLVKFMSPYGMNSGTAAALVIH
jgi:IS605 OrfB family transposase